jgi:hypothetical protein
VAWLGVLNHEDTKSRRKDKKKLKRDYMKKKTKFIFAVLFINIALALLVFGALLCFWVSENTCPKHPKTPILPKSFAKYNVYNIERDDDNWGRNEHIQRFYRAWKNKESYAIYELNRGLDCLMPTFWITDNGIVTRIIVDYPSIFKKKYLINRIDDFSIYYWVNDELKNASLENIKYQDLILKGQVDTKKKTAIGN